MSTPFATDIYSAINNTKQYPHLHRVYRHRHNAGVRKLSRCNDKFLVKKTKTQRRKVYARTDSYEFQENAKFNDFPYIRLDWGRADREAGMKNFLVECCPILDDRFIIYGTIGRGSFGVVFAARERHPPSGRKARHYALKVERHAPKCQAKGTDIYANSAYKELEETASNAKKRYIPKEAILLGLLSESDRFPTLDSVYVHGDFQVMVMSADSLDDDPLRDSLGSVFDYPTEHKFPGYPGTNLMQRRRKATKLNEMQVCKVASQLLEAMMYLMDMNIIHDDLSHRNYLVDSELNTQMIDLGLVKMSLNEFFLQNIWIFIPPQEYQMAPELAIELSKDYWRKKEEGNENPWGQVDVLLPHDPRVCMIWKFGVLIYDLLHGYSPWEDADDLEVVPIRSYPLSRPSVNPNERDDSAPPPADKVPTREDILQRRHRIINNELPIDENLSQDCVDVLRAMLDKDPRDRPTLQALCTYPWFQGQWVDAGPLQRPGRTGTSEY